MNIIVLFLLLLFSSFSFAKTEKAIFAGGCFWCMEALYEKIDGVIDVKSGYIGGKKDYPTYEEVSAGGSGYIEAIEIFYDMNKVSYEKLLEIFWKNIDPFNGKGQFCDLGDSYVSGIFTLNEAQKTVADASLVKLQSEERFKDKKVMTFVRTATTFWAAEEKHQDYDKKNPVRYEFYRWNCGRDKRLKELWD